MIRDLLNDIFELCLDINKNTKYGAFYNFLGHVDVHSVRIAKSKEEYNEWIYSEDIKTYLFEFEDEKEHEKDLIDKLQHVKRVLTNYLEGDQDGKL